MRWVSNTLRPPEIVGVRRLHLCRTTIQVGAESLTAEFVDKP